MFFHYKSFSLIKPPPLFLLVFPSEVHTGQNGGEQMLARRRRQAFGGDETEGVNLNSRGRSWRRESHGECERERVGD